MASLIPKSYTRHFTLTLVVLLLTLLCGVEYVHVRSESKQQESNLLVRLQGYTDLIDHYILMEHFAEGLGSLPSDLEVETLDDNLYILSSSRPARVGKQLSFSDLPDLQQAYYEGQGHRVLGSGDTRQLRYVTRHEGYYILITTPLSPGLSDRETIWLVLLIPCLLILIGMTIVTYRLMTAHDKASRDLRRLTDAIHEGRVLEANHFTDSEMSGVAEELAQLFERNERERQRIDDARQHLITLFDLSNIGIALFDSDGTPLFANTHFIQFAGIISSRALPRESLSLLLTEESMKPISDFLIDPHGDELSSAAIIQSGGHTFEVKAFRSTMETFDLSIEDVTTTEQTAQLKREMTSNITHEIRTPLTSIRGYLETLRYTDLTPEQRMTFTDKAYRQAERLSNMMDDISLISHMDEKDISEYRMEDLDLSLMVEEARIAYADEILRCGDTFINEIPDGLTIRANYSLIHAVFRNLIENSLHYAGPGVTLCFSCYHRDDQYVYLSYYDTGRGVPEEKLGRIFERFYRIDAGRTRSQGGSGLGLSIVRNAIKRHGGQIQARRHSPDGGLEFLFTLHK